MKIKKYNILVYVTFSFVIFFDVMFLIFFLGKLYFLHTYLIFTNTTFYEYFKKKWYKPPGFNPFSLFCGYHSCRLLCFSINKSYLHLRKEDYDNENDSLRKESEMENFKDNDKDTGNNNNNNNNNNNDDDNIIKYKK